MPTRVAGFTESIVVRAARAEVLAQLTEPARMIGLQPLIVRCKVLGQELDVDGGSKSYEAIFSERFQLAGPLGFNNHVRAFMRADRAAQVVEFTVSSFPRIRLASRYELAAEPAGTQVKLAVTIDCSLLLRALVVQAARAAHIRLLANLKSRCEGSARAE